MLRGLQVFVSGIALAGFTLAGTAVASAQEAAKPVLTLEGDATVMIVLIKPDKTADFESVIAKYKEALGEERQAGAQGAACRPEDLQVADGDGRQHRLHLRRRSDRQG